MVSRRVEGMQSGRAGNILFIQTCSDKEAVALITLLLVATLGSGYNYIRVCCTGCYPVLNRYNPFGVWCVGPPALKGLYLASPVQRAG